MSAQTMRRFAVLPALIVATALTAACDDDDVTSPEDDLVGDFTATEAVFTSNDDPNTRFDVTDEDGTLELDLREDRTFESRLDLPGRDRVVRTGTFDVQGQNLLLTENGTTRSVAFQRTGTGLTINDPGDRFDFGTGAGLGPATLDATFRVR